jgi:hypothetical protein
MRKLRVAKRLQPLRHCLFVGRSRIGAPCFQQTNGDKSKNWQPVRQGTSVDGHGVPPIVMVRMHSLRSRHH